MKYQVKISYLQIWTNQNCAILTLIDNNISAIIYEKRTDIYCSGILFTETLRKTLRATGWMKLRKCFQNTKDSFPLNLHNHKAY